MNLYRNKFLFLNYKQNFNISFKNVFCKFLKITDMCVPFPQTNFGDFLSSKAECHNITEILLKVALNTIKLNQTNIF